MNEFFGTLKEEANEARAKNATPQKIASEGT
jgi:hypothetical protein